MSWKAKDAVVNLLDLVVEAHDQHHQVGGIFNAYEKALHYELLSALYRKGCWRANQEMPLGDGHKCDLVVPLEDESRLVVEIKMWWFLRGGLAFRTGAKAMPWPACDWVKLKRYVAPPDRRAILLVRAWDDHPKALSDADEMACDLEAKMHAVGAPQPGPVRQLRGFRHPEPYASRVSGDVRVWLQ